MYTEKDFDDEDGDYDIYDDDWYDDLEFEEWDDDWYDTVNDDVYDDDLDE